MTGVTIVVTVGTVPAEFVKEVSGGAVEFPWPAQVNKLLIEGNFDLILSIGQVVPHEVVGMANYNKNIFVGTGGVEGINKSHFVGAAYGMERMMGTCRYTGTSHFQLCIGTFHQSYADCLRAKLWLDWTKTDGKIKTRGLYIGDDFEVFDKAAKLALLVNFEMLDKPLKKSGGLPRSNRIQKYMVGQQISLPYPHGHRR